MLKFKKFFDAKKQGHAYIFRIWKKIIEKIFSQKGLTVQHHSAIMIDVMKAGNLNSQKGKKNMKRITKQQARIIARKVVHFLKTYADWWDLEEKPTIRETLEDIRQHTESVYNWLCDIEIRNISNVNLCEECDEILDMLRYPEYVAGPLAGVTK